MTTRGRSLLLAFALSAAVPAIPSHAEGERRTVYKNDIEVEDSCNGKNGYCAVDLGVLSAKKYTRVSQINCYTRAASVPQQILVTTSDGKNNQVLRTFLPLQPYWDGSYYINSTQATMALLVKPGHAVSISINLSKLLSMYSSCTLFGKFEP